MTLHIPSGEQMSIYDAAMKYKDGRRRRSIVVAGKEYGTGSSRDWAAKGTMLLGVKAVIAESFERIHRSNLIGMGVLPLQFLDGQNAQTLGLTGQETFDIERPRTASSEASHRARHRDARRARIRSRSRRASRIDTPKEREYFRHGGILHYVLRQLAAPARAA